MEGVAPPRSPGPKAPCGDFLWGPGPEDEALRRKALIEAVLPKWAARCGADCVADWNATVGKVVDMQIK